MDRSDTAREEEQYRQAERAMLLAEDAAKRITAIATDLRKDHAPEHLVQIGLRGDDARKHSRAVDHRRAGVVA